MIRKKRISIGYSIVLILAFVVGLSLFMTSCGEKKPPEKLTVKIINTDNELTPDVYTRLVNDFAKAHPKIIVSCTPETVSADTTGNDLALKFRGADVVIFSSLLNRELRTLPNAFYPISTADTQLPPAVDLAYAATESGKLWSMPLMMDPMVMVLKRTFNPPETSWQMLEIYGNIFKENQGNGAPAMCVLNGRPSDLADGVVSRFLSVGFERYNLHHIPMEIDRTQEDFDLSVANGFQNWKRFLDATPTDRLSELPLVDNIDSFIDSDSAMMFARYSDFTGLSPERKQRIRLLPIPKPYESSILAYVISAGIPIESENPTRGDELIHFLLTQINEICAEQNYIPFKIDDEPGNLNQILPPKTVIIPRVNSTSLGQKLLIDALNNDMKMNDFKAIWTPGIFLPSH